MFGDRLSAAVAFADLLCGDGVVRGLIGPREPERIWSRHLLNCGVLAELPGVGHRVVDVGSGAGLPGIALSLARPDLRVDLVEPLQRRVDFLDLVVTQLGLGDRVRVVRGRAEEVSTVRSVGSADWAMARAVAPLDRLVRWCLPLVSAEGQLGLLKGVTAEAEVKEHGSALRRLGARDVTIRRCGVGVVDPPVTVVTMRSVVRKGRT